MSKADLATMRNQKIGFIFQNFHLLHQVSALANVMLPFLYSNFPKDQRRDRAMELLRLVGLEGRAHNPLSSRGGQQQRVAIAGPWSTTRSLFWRMSPPAIWTPVGARDHGAARALEQRRHDHSDGDARSTAWGARGAYHPPQRWQDPAGGSGEERRRAEFGSPCGIRKSHEPV